MSKAIPRSRLGQAGQATIEFAFTLILLMSFVFFFIQTSMVFAWGNYIHYATFMSARAYLAAGPDRKDQAERARKVMIRMVKRRATPGTDRFPMVGQGVGGADQEGGGQVKGFSVDDSQYFQKGDRSLSWMEGVRYTFKSHLFKIPFGGTTRSNDGVELTSESWLGREPSYEECMSYVQGLKGIIDNGC